MLGIVSAMWVLLRLSAMGSDIELYLKEEIASGARIEVLWPECLCLLTAFHPAPSNVYTEVLSQR